MRLVIIFCICFAVGATVALIARSALHRPYADQPMSDQPMSDQPIPATTPPHAMHDLQNHDQSRHVPTATTVANGDAAKAINTICAICGMEVDATIPTATYQGKQIGFGCALCPAKFAREPDRYGPSALQNRKTP